MPLSYRADRLPGGDDALVATIEDDTLGTLHVYDGPRDPAFAEVLLQSMLAETAVASSGDDGGSHGAGPPPAGQPRPDGQGVPGAARRAVQHLGHLRHHEQ